jgi:DNA-binding NarL/FixJ family response regulator
MKNIKILVTGRHPEVMTTIIRLINSKPEWEGTAALNQEEAVTLFNHQTFDLVLIGAGLTPDEKKTFTQFCKESRPGVRVVQHYGGGSGLLFAEVYQALGI